MAALRPTRYSWLSYLLETESPQGHSLACRITSMININDSIRNRSRGLPTCITWPQSTVLSAEITGLTWALECFERILDSRVLDKRTKLSEFREILTQRRSVVRQERQIFSIVPKSNEVAIITKTRIDKFC